MKKFAMAAIAAATLSAGVAHAYTSGTFSNGFVVPNVIHNGVTDTTAVGVTNLSGGAVGVFWVFFDQNSEHVTDGCFPMTDRDYHSFVWANESGSGLAGQRGYLVFAAGNTTGSGSCALSSTQNATALLSGNAFQVNAAASDVAFVPVIDGPLTLASATQDLTTMGPDSLTAVAGAAQLTTASGSQKFALRYYVDGVAGGNDTRIVVWSTGDHKGKNTINIFDDAQDRKSANLDLVNAELDIIDPEKISGRPGSHVDGIITWETAQLKDASGAPVAGSMFAYSVIDSPAFGAVQTLLGAHGY